MKKLIFLALLCLSASSCTFEGDEIIGSIKSTYDITVTPGQWRTVGTYGQPGYYLQATFQAPYITSNVLYEGAVVVYAEYSYGSIQLPHVISDQIGSSRFVSILSYKLNNGSITFTLEDSDFQTTPLTDNVMFKIVIFE